ncbi:MAG: lamin tail domain-containing protein, partial [Prolixibacteraceae bacterium]|nr:lamin tail domain-containing protein [Prolixibacteraceae bacterium]
MKVRVGQLFAGIFCFLLFLGNFSVLAQSIVINEVMAWNVNGITDSDDDNEDWIEIFNYGNAAVNLKGIALSDNSLQPYKWVFPDFELKPKAFLLIWASGKNHRTIGKP